MRVLEINFECSSNEVITYLKLVFLGEVLICLSREW